MLTLDKLALTKEKRTDDLVFSRIIPVPVVENISFEDIRKLILGSERSAEPENKE